MYVKTTKVKPGPPIGVMLYLVRKNEKGDLEFLVSRRLRHPFYGKVTLITGKVFFGERFEDAAARILQDETGLTAEFEIIKVYRKFGYRGRSILHDNFFVCLMGRNSEGRLKKKNELGEYSWETEAALRKRDDLIADLLERLDDVKQPKMEVLEHPYEAEGF
jgi:ADP-ribose pyrophosphatase YjhB (NUDIX family)